MQQYCLRAFDCKAASLTFEPASKKAGLKISIAAINSTGKDKKMDVFKFF